MNMKNLILVVVILTGVLSCRKNADSEFNVPRIVIKGTISGSNAKRSGSKAGNQFSLSDAKKILVFNNSSYKIFDIVNNSFSANAVSGTATAIAFLDKSNQYIGCLTAGGLNVLPLISLKDGDNTIIDLSTLTLEGMSVIPASNPFGSSILLNNGEITWYKELGSYYESLSKNIDVNNDGVPDILSKENIDISTIFNISCGTWTLNNASAQIVDSNHIFINYIVRISTGKALKPVNTNVIISGPAGSPHNDIVQKGFSFGPDCFITSFVREYPPSEGNPLGKIMLPFGKGTYTLTLENRNYTLNYATISAKHFFILAKPTIHTNTNNEIVSVSVDYRDPVNSPVTAENYVYQTQVTLDGPQAQLAQVGALWEDPEAKTNTDLFNFTLKTPVPLSQLSRLSVMYVDLIGNSYNISYEAQ
jgi:hypothetical protein